MGCDIHPYTETRDAEGRWQADAKASWKIEYPGEEDEYADMDCFQPMRSRDYAFFGLLNDVRSHCAYAFPDKGFPDDASEEVAELHAQWGSDGHSHNVITLAEMKQKAAEMLLMPSDELRDYRLEKLSKLISLLDDGTATPDNRRVVFWFDN